MPIPKIPPGWGGQSARTHFSYTGTRCASRWEAWIAGPAVWIVAHTKGRSKPCLRLMTGGVLPCPRCAQIEPPQEIGYQPLYRGSDGKPVVVIVYADERQYTDAFVLHQLVVVGREADQSDSVFLRLSLKATQYHSTLSQRMVSADCTESLLAMWAIPEWTLWCRSAAPQKTHREPLPPAPAPVRNDGSEYSEMTAAAARRWAPPPAVESEAEPDYIQAALDRAALKSKQSVNGNGKPKPKG